MLLIVELRFERTDARALLLPRLEERGLCDDGGGGGGCCERDMLLREARDAKEMASSRSRSSARLWKDE